MKTQAENTLVDLEPGDNVMMVAIAKGQPISRVVEVVEIKARAIVVDANGYGKLTFRRKTGEAWNANDSATIRLLTDEEARQYKLATEAVPAKAPKTKPAPIVGTCYCGCGQAISGKAYFRMGHDMRLHGRLGKVHTQADFEALKVEIPLALEPSFLATFHKGQFAHLPTIKTVEAK